MPLAKRVVTLTLVALVACASALLLGGCFVVRALGPLFATPRKLEHKIAHPARDDARLAVTWVGHATVLVQIDDKFVLTDPVFTSTIGMVSKRVVEPGLDLEALPLLDAVVISHVHFDHLSQSTLHDLAPKTRALLLPEGGLVYVPNLAVPAAELVRWQSWSRDGLTITAAPVQHNGMRYGADLAWRDGIGFTGWVIEYHGLRVWFGGDTTTCEACFRETSTRLGPFDLALVPIAPVNPRAYMAKYHVGPVEAVQVFEQIGADVMVPIHFDTFVNAQDELGEAPALLREEWRRQGLDPRRLAVLAIGEQRVIVAR
jgi:L-ascorbate metabolism protein UlaG (beta-lactamase superfamily)